MSNDRYQKIRDALAMGPTPGPWVQDGDGVTADDEDVAVAVCCPSDADAAFIAACDPDTIHKLLAERDQLAAALEAAREDANLVYRMIPTLPVTPETCEQATDALTQFCLSFHAAIDQARGRGEP